MEFSTSFRVTDRRPERRLLLILESIKSPSLAQPRSRLKITISRKSCFQHEYILCDLQVGQLVAETAAKTNLKRVTLELGGKSPLVVLKDVNGSCQNMHALHTV